MRISDWSSDVCSSDLTDVGEVEVDEARHNHQVSDTANTLLQHFVSKLESLLEGGVGVGDKEKILIGNDNERVDMLLQLGNASVGGFAATRHSKRTGLGYDEYGKYGTTTRHIGSDTTYTYTHYDTTKRT